MSAALDVPPPADAGAAAATAGKRGVAAVLAVARRVGTRRVRVGLVLALLAVLAVEKVRASVVEETLSALAGTEPAWVAVAGLAAAASMSAFARARRRLLGAAGVAVPLRGSVASVYAANALHVTLPGGAAFSTAYSYRWMLAAGATVPVAAWVLVAGGLVSTGTLVGLGVVSSLLRGGPAQPALQMAGIGAVLAAAAAARLVMRRPAPAVRAARAILERLDRVSGRPPGTSADRFATLLRQLRSVRPRGRDWATVSGFAVLNWLLDAMCLTASASAVGVHGIPVPTLLLAYTAGMATSSLSLLPAGVGVVDSAMVLTLVACGLPASAALPAVVLYRMVSVGGTAAVGWLLLALRLVPAPWPPPAAAGHGGREDPPAAARRSDPLP